MPLDYSEMCPTRATKVFAQLQEEYKSSCDVCPLLLFYKLSPVIAKKTLEAQSQATEMNGRSEG